MKTNAFARNVRLYKVWGDPTDPPYLDLINEPMFVCWSPTFKQWIASVTSLDRRYDAIVGTSNFVLDSSLLPTEAPATGPSWYLQKLRSGTTSK